MPPGSGPGSIVNVRSKASAKHVSSSQHFLICSNVWASYPSAALDATNQPPEQAPRLPGVGKVTEEKLAKLEVKTVAELRKLDLPRPERHFGRYGVRLHELARGVDESEVVPDRPTQSIFVEDTFEQDVLLSETEPMIRRLAEKLRSASRKELRIARTVVLKLKTSQFKILTRSHTPHSPPSPCEELTDIALKLTERVYLGPQQRYRLAGVGLSNFREREETTARPALFE